ncbi:unnamed protein product [Mesocestoides corti]|uniref:Uncharacterized protein n=1 Tax=Mesocestoides corti TaxID=53468 RepID=A0A0R3UEP9_MESCO|nr:unnamed protein product [Mesocestoides corti]
MAKAENLNSIVGEAFRIAYAQQRALLESRRAATQTQTVNVTVAGDAASPPSATAYPVTELDSGIATANASSFRKVYTGYAADSGLSSSESASRVPKPRPIHGASDGDERHPVARKSVPSGVDESVGESPTGPVSSKVTVTQSHRCQPQNDTEFSAPNKREKPHKERGLDPLSIQDVGIRLANTAHSGREDGSKDEV